MPLVPMRQLLRGVSDDGTGLGAMNVIALEQAEAIVAGAELADRPVVLQVSENAASYHRGAAPLLLACLRVAAESSAAVTVHLDHATSADLVRSAVGLGVGSVMFDGSTLPYDQNVAATAELASWCHEQDASIEAELGEVGGKDGVHAPGARTDPGQAQEFVAATGVDALAVAVGSSHAMLTRDAVLDEELIARLAAAVPVPLVLHGSSGVADEALQRAVGAGMRKINIATHLNQHLTAGVRQVLADPSVVDPRVYLGAGRRAVELEVARLLGMLARPLAAVAGSA